VRLACAVTQLSLEPGKFQDLTDTGQRGQFEHKLRNIQNADTSSVQVYGPEGFQPLNWREWAVDRSIGAANAYQLLVPFFPFFESELIQLINDVALSDFVTMHREIAGVPVTGGDMGSIACIARGFHHSVPEAAGVTSTPRCSWNPYLLVAFLRTTWRASWSLPLAAACTTGTSRPPAGTPAPPTEWPGCPACAHA